MHPKTDQEIENIRVSGKMLAAVLSTLTSQATAGVTTLELADMATAELKRLGGQPVFLGYQGFPSCICISVNEEIVHGIPGSRELAEGDIVGLDFGVNYRGMITDGAVTVGVGFISDEAQRLLDVTQESMYAGIDQVKAGARIGDISRAIEARLKADHLGVIEELAGHGVGHELHEDPWIPNFTSPNQGPILRVGMTIAIEPMATLGTHKVAWGSDGWTVSSADGSLGAQFEHTVLVLEDGFEILTQR